MVGGLKLTENGWSFDETEYWKHDKTKTQSSQSNVEHLLQQKGVSEETIKQMQVFTNGEIERNLEGLKWIRELSVQELQGRIDRYRSEYLNFTKTNTMTQEDKADAWSGFVAYANNASQGRFLPKGMTMIRLEGKILWTDARFK
jgi:hypothetical protein